MTPDEEAVVIQKIVELLKGMNENIRTLDKRTRAIEEFLRSDT